ncbi:cysteine proteinase [Myriangium duriaei CBS 260.36]|uniref:Cysteine proteinase n=1 Tax=Myriangium duriaei CBS 260.36 TaxID=1168546 RepID=A0A9P4J6H2_9PEZI|nr:cysteine proteinase [Myriangium duriaei CBS 260.36]
MAEEEFHTLTPEQLGAFYARINLPAQHRHLPGAELTALLRSQSASLAFLSVLQRHCVSSLPFENLSLHYDLHHTVHLATDYVFDKMVTRGAGRGGYCMELNGLLAAVLRSLGFDVRTMGGKVNESVMAQDHSKPRKDLKYSGWNHMVLIVVLPKEGEKEEVKYLFDIGFGGGNPTGPMLLKDGETRINSPGSEDGEGKEHVLRLSRERVGDNEVWVLERLVLRPGLAEGGEFRPFYCFTDVSFSPEDFEIMNHHVANGRRSFFTYSIFAVKSVLSEDGEKVIGDVTIFEQRIRRREYGKTVLEKTFQSEQERIKGFEEHFGLKLSAIEKGSIHGLASEIKG